MSSSSEDPDPVPSLDLVLDQLQDVVDVVEGVMDDLPELRHACPDARVRELYADAGSRAALGWSHLMATRRILSDAAAVVA